MLAFHFELLFRVALGGGEVFAQLLGRAAWPVARGIALNAPSLFERSRIHGVEAKLVQKSSDYGLGVRIITCDDERAPILGAQRLSVLGQLCGVDVVKSLDDFRTRAC